MCERAEDPQEALASAIDALAAVDTITLADQDLHELVIGLEAEESRFAAIRARLLAAWDGRRLWADDGPKSATARLSRECDASPMTGRLGLRRARNRRPVPGPAMALRQGRRRGDKPSRQA